MFDFLADLAANKTVVHIVGPVLLLGILIFVHEFGHFSFAKLFGVGVEKFSFGFGPRIFGITWRGTEYRVSWIPLGGYVKMAGDDPFEEEPDTPMENSLQERPPWQRFLIFLAGPLFNLLLPILLFAGVYMIGPPEPIAWVGRFTPHSPARAAGLQLGDRILKVADKPVRFFDDLRAAVDSIPPGGTVALEIERHGERMHVDVPLVASSDGTESSGDDTQSLGVHHEATVSKIGIQDVPGSPARDAGLKFGDTIEAIDGQPVTWWFEVDRHLRDAQGNPVALQVERDGDRLTFTVSPRDYAFTPETTGPTAPEPIPASTLADALPGAPYGLFPAETFVEGVVSGKPASRAGIESGDMVLKINGHVIRQWTDIHAQVEAAGSKPLDIILVRKGHLVPVSVAPEVVIKRGPGGHPRKTHQIGIISAGLYQSAKETLKLGPIAALARGTRETIRVCVESVEILAHILMGDVPLSESLGGPISIVTVAARSAAESIFTYLRVMALISVSLGLINLFPIPLLDGGHIMFLFLEFVRGKPVSMRFREISQQIGMIILFILMAFALANDVRINYFR